MSTIDRSRLVGLATVILLTACGTGGDEAQVAPQAPSASVDAPVPVDLPRPVPVESVERVADFLPMTIGPLAPDQQPRVDTAGLFEIIRTDPIAARFFEQPGAVEESSVRVGGLLELDQAGKPSAGATPTPGYVVEGGSSECMPSRPPGSKESGPVACTALVVVDGIRGVVVRVSEVGTVAPSPSAEG